MRRAIVKRRKERSARQVKVESKLHTEDACSHGDALHLTAIRTIEGACLGSECERGAGRGGGGGGGMREAHEGEGREEGENDVERITA